MSSSIAQPYVIWRHNRYVQRTNMFPGMTLHGGHKAKAALFNQEASYFQFLLWTPFCSFPAFFNMGEDAKNNHLRSVLDMHEAEFVLTTKRSLDCSCSFHMRHSEKSDMIAPLGYYENLRRKSYNVLTTVTVTRSRLTFCFCIIIIFINFENEVQRSELFL